MKKRYYNLMKYMIKANELILNDLTYNEINLLFDTHLHFTPVVIFVSALLLISFNAFSIS